MDVPPRVPLLLFLFFTLLYGVTMPGYLQISDSEFSLKTAQALVQRGTFELEPDPAKAGYMFIREDGRAFSKFGVGLALIWTPFVALARGIAPITGMPTEFVTHFVVSTYSIFFGAAGVVVFYLLARAFRVGQRNAVWLTLAFGAGTIIWKYSVYDFSEIAQAGLLAAATYAAWRNTPRSVGVMTVLLSLNVWTKVASAIYVPVFLGYVIAINLRDRRAILQRLLISAATGAIFVAALLWLNWLRFGHPLESGYGGQAAMFSEHPLRNAASLLFSWEKGVFFYSPILLFGLLGFPRFLASHRAEAGLFAALILVSLGFHSLYVYYEGGWCWGPRFLVPVTFALFLPAGLLLEHRPLSRPWFGALLAVSVGVQIVAVLEKDQEYLTLRHVLHQDPSRPLPPPIPGHAFVLRHKLTQDGNVYTARELGADSDAQLDASGFSTFRGMNLWYCHIARSLDRDVVKWVPLLVLPLLLWTFVALLHQARRVE